MALTMRPRPLPHLLLTGGLVTHAGYVAHLRYAAARSASVGDRRRADALTAQAALYERKGEDRCEVCHAFRRQVEGR